MARTIAGILVGLALNTLSMAQDADGNYVAHYEGEYKGMDVTAVRTFSCADNQCQLKNEITALLGNISETSTLTPSEDGYKSLDYEYQQKILLNTRTRSITFADNIAHYSDRNGDRELPLEHPTYDSLNYQLLLSKAATQGVELVEFHAIRRGKIVPMKFKLIASETIELNGKSIATMHYSQLRKNKSRHTDIWLAPELNGALVKLVFSEDDSTSQLHLRQFCKQSCD